MAENTGISWADHTFNPWIGCQAVSPACDNCYAERLAERFGWAWGPKSGRRRTGVQNWNKVRSWQRKADAFKAEHGRRPVVFVASLADVFDNAVPPEWRADLWSLIRACPDLLFLLLTKRPQNIHDMLPADWGGIEERNVWLGITAENQEEYERRMNALYEIDAAGKFVSAEPMLGPVDMTNDFIDFVICGGESGPGARPTHPDWARQLRDACAANGVPFHFKQWGEWLPWESADAPFWRSQAGDYVDGHLLFPADMDSDPAWDDGLGPVAEGAPHAAFQRVGVRAARRLLDGRLHLPMPGSAEGLR